MDDRMSYLPPPPRRPAPSAGRQVALVDLLDRVLAGGVVITGDITISIANVDLVRVSLRAMVATIRPEMDRVVRADVLESEDEPVRPSRRELPP